ncbi:MAG: WXG100 family type VII secretion target [Leifsonia sp.]|jgi:WXG100 family type VII secretion target|uniref:WXG100 family type VII secretion target n=1 Tax=unclassified Leifsonia TaxID=2663824 RepID=UPI0008A784BC|nr:MULTISPECIES: WXG100 family type VII secretion target [unclassified Leifsonia]SEH56214.1 WXG100 family type VII secretion target [Leifsonia sp. CL154]SFL22801.1 WXG100 family type VII secretion target [Leifsonia sp. CL147]
MNDISLTPESMRGTASKLDGGQGEIKALLARLQGEVNSLLGSNFVTQKASPAFGEGYSKLNSSMGQAVDGITQMTGALRNMAQSAEDWDAQNAHS